MSLLNMFLLRDAILLNGFMMAFIVVLLSEINAKLKKGYVLEKFNLDKLFQVEGET